MTELMMFGYRARLVLDMPDGERDATEAVELITTPEMRADHAARSGFWVNTERLLEAIAARPSKEKEYRQAALELNASIRNGLAWIGSGNPDFTAHNDMRRTADKWRDLLEDEDA